MSEQTVSGHMPGTIRTAAARSVRGWLLFLLSVLMSPQLLAAGLQVQFSDAETGEPLQWAVVEVLLPEAIRADYLTPVETEIDQQQKEFIDTVTVVPAGSRIGFPNSDNILHHVYSFSAAKVFELPLYGNDQNVNFVETFPEPGVVELGCNIHDWMLAYIYIAESNLAAASGPDGLVTLEGIPAGSYELRLWHARAEEDDPVLRQRIEIRDGSPAQLDVSLALQRDNRLRRAPAAGQARYR